MARYGTRNIQDITALPRLNLFRNRFESTQWIINYLDVTCPRRRLECFLVVSRRHALISSRPDVNTCFL